MADTLNPWGDPGALDVIEEVRDTADKAYDNALSVITMIRKYQEDNFTPLPTTAVTIEDPSKPINITLDNIDTMFTMPTIERPIGLDLDKIDVDITIDPLTPPDVEFPFPPEPDIPDISADRPDPTYAYNETPYQSNIHNAISAAILSEIQNGSTGLTPTVEADIYNRESERDLLELQNTRDKVALVWAESGMPMPDGVIVSAVNALQTEYQNKKSDKSRDVRIESFKRADDNARFIKDLAVKLEGILREYTGGYWTRQLESAKTVLGYAQAVYDTLIKYQELFIRRYSARVDGYKATVDGLSSQSDAKAKVFTAQVGYLTGKADAEVRVIGAKVEAQKAEIMNGQLDVAIYEADSRYAVATSEVKAKTVGMQIDKNKLTVEKYQADTQMYDTDAKFKLGKADTFIKNFAVIIEQLKENISLANTASTNLAHIAGSIAAGALSALNGHASVGNTVASSSSSSESFNYGHDMTKGLIPGVEEKIIHNLSE